MAGRDGVGPVGAPADIGLQGDFQVDRVLHPLLHQLGSDFDGATMPAALGDAAGLPGLLDAFRAAGFAEDELEQVAGGNWRRVLEATWTA